MSRKEIRGISGWELIAPLVAQAPAWVCELGEKAESPIERVFLCSVALATLNIPAGQRPKVKAQVPIDAYRADMVIIGHNGAPRIVVECDGEAFHRDKKRDAKRTETIERMGYRVLRVTGSEIHNNPLGRAMALMREAGFIQ